MPESRALLPELIEMRMTQIIQRADDPVIAIGCQKSLQQILFVPEQRACNKPLFGIIAGREYVVDVHDDAFIQNRQQFEIFEQNVALRPYHVRRIDKQDVIFL